MDGISRRSLFVAGAGVAAGVAVVSLPGSSSVASAAGAQRGDADAAGGVDGAVVHVRDASRGELVIMSAGSEVTVTDHRLVAALGRAARTGKKA